MLSELTECSSPFREQQDFRKIYYPERSPDETGEAASA